MEASITFETVTPESCEQGDFEDHGWITPNDYRVSLGKAGRHYMKRVRMSQRGRYDWTSLRDAVEYILDKARYVQSEVDVDVHTWQPGRSWLVRVTVERSGEDEYNPSEAIGYSLHVSGLSQGSADRLERLFVNAGCRRPYARSSSMRRTG